MISGCMHGKARIAKLSLKFRLRSFVKLNASFVVALKTLLVLHKDPGLRGWQPRESCEAVSSAKSSLEKPANSL